MPVLPPESFAVDLQPLRMLPALRVGGLAQSFCRRHTQPPSKHFAPATDSLRHGSDGQQDPRKGSHNVPPTPPSGVKHSPHPLPPDVWPWLPSSLQTALRGGALLHPGTHHWGQRKPQPMTGQCERSKARAP